MTYFLFSEKQTKAKKTHKCIWCGESIIPHEIYIREKSVYDKDMQNFAWHLECKDDQGFALDNGETEFTPYSAPRPIYV